MDLIESFLVGVTKLGIFLYFGLPVIIGAIIIVISIFQSSSIFSPKGRINRKKYIAYLFYSMAIIIISSVIVFTIRSNILIVVVIPAFILLTIFILMNNIKRLHDLNCSGWIAIAAWLSSLFINFLDNQLLDIVSLIFYIPYFIALVFVKGTKGKNKYGEDPLEENIQHE